MKPFRVILLLLTALCLFPLCHADSAETLTLPESLTDVEEAAFSGNESLDTVVLPEGLQTIGSKAFASSSVKTVNLPDSLTFIADDAFDDTDITGLTVHEGTYAYSWAVSHGYLGWEAEEQPDGTLAITGFTHTADTVTIPRQIGGKQVSAISDMAFAGSTGLKHVTVPGTIGKIGEAAFAGIFSLETLTVEQGVNTIGSEAFSDCPNLKSVTLPESGALLNEKLFRYCTALKTVTLPQGITEIPYQCFWQCESLQSIDIPEGVTSIANGAFYMCSSLKTFTGPESLVSIGKNAFHNCMNLETITLSASVTDIDETAFSDCEFAVMDAPEGSVAALYGASHDMVMENVVLESPHPYTEMDTWEYTGPEDAAALKITFSPRTSFDPTFNIDYLLVTDAEGSQRAYYGNQLAGETLVLPGNRFSLFLNVGPFSTYFGFRVTDVTPLDAAGYQAYLDELALNPWKSRVVNGTLEITAYLGRETDLTIPSHINGAPVSSIADRAFQGNRILTRVRVEEGITKIGTNAFNMCSNLKEVILPDSITELGDSVFVDCESLTDVVYPKGLSAIPPDTFAGCSALSGFDISENVTRIGRGAFSYCTSLTSLVIPDQVTEVGRQAFAFSGLVCLEIGSGLTETSDNMCQSCENLTSVTLPETLASVGSGSFIECNSLSQITLPSGLKEISDLAFSNCALTELTLPEGLETIGTRALGGTALKRIVIPGSVTSLDTTAFQGAEDLTEIVFPDDHPLFMSVGSCVFDRTDNTLLFVLPSLQGELQLPEGVTRIADSAFTNCLISGAVLPASLEWIGDGLFQEDKLLTRVVIEAPITTLPNYTFNSCSSLTDVTLPDTITSIGAVAFSHSGIRTLKLPSQLQSIQIGAFSMCDNLETLVLPDGMKELGMNAIAYCPNLVSVTVPASVESIGFGNFSMCDQVVIHTPAGSYAEEWAKSNGIPVVTE